MFFILSIFAFHKPFIVFLFSIINFLSISDKQENSANNEVETPFVFSFKKIKLFNCSIFKNQ